MNAPVELVLQWRDLAVLARRAQPATNAPQLLVVRGRLRLPFGVLGYVQEAPAGGVLVKVFVVRVVRGLGLLWLLDLRGRGALEEVPPGEGPVELVAKSGGRNRAIVARLAQGPPEARQRLAVLACEAKCLVLGGRVGGWAHADQEEKSRGGVKEKGWAHMRIKKKSGEEVRNDASKRI